jgi:hypothetical protein
MSIFDDIGGAASDVAVSQFFPRAPCARRFHRLFLLRRAEHEAVPCAPLGPWRSF